MFIGLISLVLALFLFFNVAAYRLLVRLHPAHRGVLRALTILGNAAWPIVPFLNARTDLSRLLRALLGPPWFAWQCFAILYVAFVAIVMLLLFVARRPPLGAIAHGASKAFLIAVAIGGLAGCWQALVPLRVAHVPVLLRYLPPELEGKRIALLGDLHVGLFSRPSRLHEYFATAASLHPDAVIIAGDLLDDDPHFAPKLLAATRALPPALPLFAVLGNHEMYGDPFAVIRELRGSRIHLLVNEGAPLGRLWIAGLSDYAASRNGRTRALLPDLGAALRGKPADAFPLVVAHQPHGFDDARRLGLPLTVCAHTHGGQLGFRPFGWSLAGVFLPFHMGLYERGPSQLYVNTGTGFWLLPFRLGMTGEITLIELRRK